MEITDSERFALQNLSTGVHCLREDNSWRTVSITGNSAQILGMPASLLMQESNLWLSRVHPSDVDALKGALQSTSLDKEKNISYRFRDSFERYRWIGLRCKRFDETTVVGMFSDITRQRVLEYSDRIHLAGRDSLRALLNSGDLNESINEFLQLISLAIVVNRAKLIRFRKDGKAFITHEWSHDEDSSIALPAPVLSKVADWWKSQFELLGMIAVKNINDSSLPDELVDMFKVHSSGAVMAVPAIVNNVIEGFVCFETIGERTWLPVELEEVKNIIDGYSRAVERRIEDRKQIADEFHIRRSEERYRLLTEHSPVILFGIDSEGIFTLSEGLGLHSMGADAGEVVGKSVYHIYRNYPDILEQVNTALSGLESHGITHIDDKCFEVWFTPVCDEEKIVIGLSGVAVDITKRNKLEQQQAIMMSELDHRVKNNIAAVMSLVGMSQQGAATIEDFAKTLDGRLHALSVAHSTLAKSHWSGAWIRDILSLTLQPYMGGGVDRILFDGPDIELPGLLARPMCMVIHELVTNAVKYGALSSANEGKVIISTIVNVESTNLVIKWQELGGPPILGDIEPGTGTTLLKGLIFHEMHGTIQLDYQRNGLSCEISIPLTEKL